MLRLLSPALPAAPLPGITVLITAPVSPLCILCRFWHRPHPAVQHSHIIPGLRQDKCGSRAAPPALAVGDIFLAGIQYTERVTYIVQRHVHRPWQPVVPVLWRIYV